MRLIRETQQDPFEGIGRPEPLEHDLTGCWSRRINQNVVLSAKCNRREFASSPVVTTIEIGPHNWPPPRPDH
ncbi:MAG: type II toxin-antitoxin system YoeB family toxin, partial [Ignavibacteriota bacterium]